MSAKQDREVGVVVSKNRQAIDPERREAIYRRWLGNVDGFTANEKEMLMELVNVDPERFVHIKGGCYAPVLIRLLVRWAAQNGYGTQHHGGSS